MMLPLAWSLIALASLAYAKTTPSSSLSLVVSGGELRILSFDGKSTVFPAGDALPGGSWVSLNQDASWLLVTDEASKMLATYGLADSKLTPATTASTTGQGPVMNGLVANETFAVTGAYGNGVVDVFHFGKEGSLTKNSTVTFKPPENPGASPFDVSRAHGTIVDPTDQFVVVPNLGANLIHILSFQDGLVSQLPNTPSSKADNGPRHAVFSGTDSSPKLHVVNEQGSSVDTFAACYADNQLTLSLLGDAVSTLNDSETGKSAAAEILLAPNGKWLLVSNRPQPATATDPMAEGSIAVLSLKDNNKTPVALKTVTTSGGVNPRSMALSADGKFLAVTNQGDNDGKSSCLAIFSFDQDSGSLSAKPLVQYTDIKTPQTVAWVEPKSATKVAAADFKLSSVCKGGSSSSGTESSSSKGSSVASPEESFSGTRQRLPVSGSGFSVPSGSASSSGDAHPSSSSAGRTALDTILLLSLVGVGFCLL